MKLLKTVLLLALHGAHASAASHKATKNAVDAETTQSLAVEAATASVVKMPGAVAKLFGRAEGAEVPAKQAQGPVEQHQDHFKAGHAPGKVDIYYLGVEGPPAEFVLVDTKSGKEHVIPIEAGTHITYDNSVYAHRVDAHPDSKRTMLGPASLPSGGRRLDAVGCGECRPGVCGDSCTPCCTGGEENCEVARCGSGRDCLGCEAGYTGPGAANAPECEDDCFDRRRKLRAGGRKALFAYPEPDVTLADGCCDRPRPGRGVTRFNGVKCRSDLNDFIGTFTSFQGGSNKCWRECLEKYPDELVAIDWYSFPSSGTFGQCYCQNACECVIPAAEAQTYTRDSKVDALPDECK